MISSWDLFILKLTDLRGDKMGPRPVPIAVFDRMDKLTQWYNAQLEEWDDAPSPDFFGVVRPYHKYFKKGSPLEWYIPSVHSKLPDDGIGFVTVEVCPTAIDFDIPLNPTYKE